MSKKQYCNTLLSSAPVLSVNDKTGHVSLKIEDIPKLSEELKKAKEGSSSNTSDIKNVQIKLNEEIARSTGEDSFLDGRIASLKLEVNTHTTNTSNPHAVTKAQVGLGNVDNTSDLNKPVSTAVEAKILNSQNLVQGSVEAHKKDLSNPHKVTKSQVGLGNVDNTSDLNKPVSTATSAEISRQIANSDSKLISHISDLSNPHSVTKSQVGLGNVDNTNDLDKPVSIATKSFIVSEVREVENEIVLHASDLSNPHAVTKVQVGLGNVDNTSDLNKPVSTATDKKFISVIKKQDADRSELLSVVGEKADKSYVDEKLSSISGGLAGSYLTLALAEADKANIPVNSTVNITNDPTPSKNGQYTWDGTKFTKSAFDPLAEAKEYVDAKPTINPLRIDKSMSLDAITLQGYYLIPTDVDAQGLGIPSGLYGIVYCSGYTKPPNLGFIYQTVTDRLGGVFFRVRTLDGWSLWKGESYQGISPSSDLNEVYLQGTYNVYTAIAEGNNTGNFPFVGAGSSGILQVKHSESLEGTSVINQVFSCSRGIATRLATRKDNINSWKEWSGLQFKDGEIGDLDSYLTLGEVNQIIVTDISQIGGHLDNTDTNGLYQLNTSSVASRANGFPIVAAGGFLTVKRNASGAIHQMWETYGGYAFRWGSTSTSPPTWQPWRGFRSSENSIVNVAEIQKDKTKLIVYGSSTLEYLKDEFTAMCEKYNLELRTKALSGETINGAGFSVGSNTVTLSFPSGSITQSKNPVVVTQSMEGRIPHKTTPVTLSNGVSGTLTYDSATKTHSLTPTGFFSPINGIQGLEFDAIVPDWYNMIEGVIVINIGKNNVGYDSLDIILRMTKEFIDYLPKDSKYIVGGHFSNTNSTDTIRDEIDSINSTLKNTYGLRYFDINELLFSDSTWTKLGLTKTPEDIEAIQGRRKPPSLSRDNGHLSAEMDQILADRIEQVLLNMKYIGT